MVGQKTEAQLNNTLIAIADPKRRAILRRLAKGDARVTEIAAPFDVSLNAISKHIKLLERGGLVERRRVGREHVLSFKPEPLTKVQNWIEKQTEFWQASLSAIDAMLQDEDKANKE